MLSFLLRWSLACIFKYLGVCFEYDMDSFSLAGIYVSGLLIRREDWQSGILCIDSSACS